MHANHDDRDTDSDAKDAECQSVRMERSKDQAGFPRILTVGDRPAVDHFLDTCVRLIPPDILARIMEGWIIRLGLPSTSLKSGQFLLNPFRKFRQLTPIRSGAIGD
jgi:hypothetical protein